MLMFSLQNCRTDKSPLCLVYEAQFTEYGMFLDIVTPKIKEKISKKHAREDLDGKKNSPLT